MIAYSYRAPGLYEFEINGVGFKVKHLEAEFGDRAGRWMLTMGENSVMEWVGEYDTKRRAMQIACAICGEAS